MYQQYQRVLALVASEDLCVKSAYFSAEMANDVHRDRALCVRKADAS